MLNRACAVAFFFALCYFLVVASTAAVSQVDRGAIVGMVTDPTGARVSGAQVTIISLSTDQPINVTTDEDGNYTAKLLKIGTYSVSTTKPGFQTTVLANAEVAVNQVLRLDLVLKVGSTSERGRGDWSCSVVAIGNVFTDDRNPEAHFRAASERKRFYPTRLSWAGSQWWPDRVQRQRWCL